MAVSSAMINFYTNKRFYFSENLAKKARTQGPRSSDRQRGPAEPHLGNRPHITRRYANERCLDYASPVYANNRNANLNPDPDPDPCGWDEWASGFLHPP